MTPTNRDPSLPWAKSVASRSLPEARKFRETIKCLIAQRGLCGLANDTKWNEFLAEMRPRAAGHKSWRFSWRSKAVNGYISDWDVEWFHHLPFPFLTMEWFDVAFLEETEETIGHLLPTRKHLTDHSPWLEEVLQRVGLDYLKGQTMIRIFGYSPKDMHLFDIERAGE